MQHLINIHWMGIRKDSGKGSIWGYFTEVGKSTDAHFVYGYNGNKSYWVFQPCYIFRGKIGKSLIIEEGLLSNDFLASISGVAKNYRECDPKKITSKWGAALDEELGMFLTMSKLRG
jgi:hypothetical protein